MTKGKKRTLEVDNKTFTIKVPKPKKGAAGDLKSLFDEIKQGLTSLESLSGDITVPKKLDMKKDPDAVAKFILVTQQLFEAAQNVLTNVTEVRDTAVAGMAKFLQDSKSSNRRVDTSVGLFQLKDREGPASVTDAFLRSCPSLQGTQAETIINHPTRGRAPVTLTILQNCLTRALAHEVYNASKKTLLELSVTVASGKSNKRVSAGSDDEEGAKREEEEESKEEEQSESKEEEGDKNKEGEDTAKDEEMEEPAAKGGEETADSVKTEDSAKGEEAEDPPKEEDEATNEETE